MTYDVARMFCGDSGSGKGAILFPAGLLAIAFKKKARPSRCDQGYS
jgi:hypothetical protein